MTRAMLVGALVAAATVACSTPVTRHSPVPTAVARGGDDADVATPDPPVVQVRRFPAEVSVVAWDKEDARIGLRTIVNRNGTLIGGLRFGDHQLYMTPFYADYFGGFMQAMLLPTRELLSTSVYDDNYSCFFGTSCSPMRTIGVRVPDAVLRAKRDSFVVTFIPSAFEPWEIAFRRELIDEYLAKVDSVVAEMNRADGR